MKIPKLPSVGLPTAKMPKVPRGPKSEIGVDVPMMPKMLLEIGMKGKRGLGAGALRPKGLKMPKVPKVPKV